MICILLFPDFCFFVLFKLKTVGSGLPFASGSHYYPGVITHDTLLTGCAGGYVSTNSNSPTFIPIGDGTTTGKLPATGNTKYIMFAATYYTST